MAQLPWHGPATWSMARCARWFGIMAFALVVLGLVANSQVPFERFECSKSEPSLAGDGEEPDRAKRAKRQLWPILLLQLWVSKLFPEPSSSSVFESHLFLHRVCHDRTC
jgi:hypothetical protein